MTKGGEHRTDGPAEQSGKHDACELWTSKPGEFGPEEEEATQNLPAADLTPAGKLPASPVPTPPPVSSDRKARQKCWLI